MPLAGVTPDENASHQEIKHVEQTKGFIYKPSRLKFPVRVSEWETWLENTRRRGEMMGLAVLADDFTPTHSHRP